MSKSVKKWLKVQTTLDGDGVAIEGHQYKGVYFTGQECYLYLTPKEADWLIQQIYEAMPATGRRAFKAKKEP